jgi:hypothetical protein
VALDDFFDRAEREPGFEPDERGDAPMNGKALLPAPAIVDAETWTSGPGGAATGAGSR